MFMCIHVLQSSNFVCHTIHFADWFANISGNSLLGILNRFNILFNLVGKCSPHAVTTAFQKNLNS